MLIFSTLTSACGRRVLHHSQARPAAGPLGTRLNTALSPHGPGGGLSRTWPAGPRPWRPRYARQSISQSQGGVSTCTVTARSAGPPSHQARGPPTGQARRHAQDITAPAPPPTGRLGRRHRCNGPGNRTTNIGPLRWVNRQPGLRPSKISSGNLLQPAGPSFALNNSHKSGPAGPRNTDEKVHALGFNARFSALRREKKFLAQRIDMRNVMQIVLFNIARNCMSFPIYSPYRAERQERCA
jgi:hypothetical protein